MDMEIELKNVESLRKILARISEVRRRYRSKTFIDYNIGIFMYKTTGLTHLINSTKYSFARLKSAFKK